MNPSLRPANAYKRRKYNKLSLKKNSNLRSKVSETKLCELRTKYEYVMQRANNICTINTFGCFVGNKFSTGFQLRSSRGENVAYFSNCLLCLKPEREPFYPARRPMQYEYCHSNY